MFQEFGCFGWVQTVGLGHRNGYKAQGTADSGGAAEWKLPGMSSSHATPEQTATIRRSQALNLDPFHF